MLKEIVIAVQSYIDAHRFIQQHRLWKWIVIPGIIYAILFLVSMYFFGKSATAVIEYLTHATHLSEWLQRFRNGFLGFLFTFAGIMLWLILMLSYFSLFKYIWLILGSPVFAYLSEKTESIIEGKTFPFSFPQLVRDAGRGIRLALRNMLWQTVYAVSLLFLSLVPVAGWITPLIALFLECFFYGFSMMDYSSERHKLTASQSVEFISKHRGLAIGNGLVFFLMHGLVLVGWVLAPAYAVVAATLSLYKVKQDL
ncbi:MAG TPA: EI24 domain-containing protein [Chitinophagaceae bacterium]|nr:EI24 domain-containing protein [Chitinophagaceae bacterium]